MAARPDLSYSRRMPCVSSWQSWLPAATNSTIPSIQITAMQALRQADCKTHDAMMSSSSVSVTSCTTPSGS